MKNNFHRLAVIATILALCVVVLGAYVRLSHAGLGCPDWPGCYGQLTWPEASAEITTANEAFPDRPVETDKAWKEMVHRYVAGILVLLVVALNISAWRNKSLGLRFASFALLVLIIFQALLGMWTVTLKLKPIVVMGHLMGGMATFSLLLWLSMRSSIRYSYDPPINVRAMGRWITFAIVLLLFQIALGGWTSANYAALSCPDFPTCMNQWWPTTDFKEAFVLWREVGVDYEGGLLDHSARVAIHLTHRIGAVVMLLVLGILSLKLLRIPAMQRGALVLLAMLLLQLSLGVLNVVLHLPLINAAAHNGGAALLLGCLIWLLHKTKPRYQASYL